MRLRTKLTALIALASVVPIGAATLVGRELVQRRSKTEFARLLGDARVEVQARYREMQEQVTRTVEGLANPEDQFVGSILIDLAKGGLQDETFRRLAVVAPRVMQERGLDVLTVLDRQGRILASGHFPGQMGDNLPGWNRRNAPREARLGKQRVMEQGKPASRYAVVVSREARSPLGMGVTVIGGRILGPGFVKGLRLRGATEVLIRDAAGHRLAGPPNWERYRDYPHEVITLGTGPVRVTATVAVPDDSLRRTLKAINVTAGALVASGLLLALILGVAAARRISRPLQELSEGAGAVAQGDLDRQLPVRSRDEVGQLVQAFNRMTGELKDSKERLVAAERVAAWREIARRIAHEIKNPLFPIQTSIETLRKARQKAHPDFEEIFEESTTTILQEVERLKNIATEFSQFARMPKPELVPCDLGDLLSSVVKLYGDDAVHVEGDIPPDLPRVLGDREQLIQVFSNLVKNAKEACAAAQSPRVRVVARPVAGGVETEVQDNGPGFSEEVEAKMFTPYFTTKGSSGGSGLGLAIVHRIVMDHDGRIAASSAQQGGQGASFTVTLPLTEPVD